MSVKWSLCSPAVGDPRPVPSWVGSAPCSEPPGAGPGSSYTRLGTPRVLRGPGLSGSGCSRPAAVGSPSQASQGPNKPGLSSNPKPKRSEVARDSSSLWRARSPWRPLAELQRLWTQSWRSATWPRCPVQGEGKGRHPRRSSPGSERCDGLKTPFKPK